MEVNLKLLQAFLSVAEHESFRRAADASGRSQPAISAQVKRLEAQLGLPLFQRTTRRVTLTTEGRQLLERTHALMAELSAGLQDIREAADARSGRVSLGCSPTVASTRLPPILAAFNARHPGVAVRVRELASGDMLAAIETGDVEFGVGPRVPGRAGFAFRTVLVDEIRALVPAGSKLAGAGHVPFAALVGQPLIMITGHAALQETIEAAARQSGAALTLRYEVQQAQTLLAMAEAGLGIGLVPAVALPAGQGRSAVSLPLGPPALTREITIVTVQGKKLSPVAGRLASMIAALIGGAPRAPGRGRAG